MARVVLRVAPLNRTQLLAAAAHVERRNLVDDAHINHDRSCLNVTLFGSGNIIADCDKILSSFSQSRVNRGAQPIEVAQMILTARAEWFDPKWRDNPSVLKPWIDANLGFLKARYGDQLASVTLHLDEDAPHLDAFIVPLSERNFVTERNGIRRETVKRVVSYNSHFGDTKATLAQARMSGTSDDTKLGRLQTAYADSMAHLGLERGIRKSESKHVSPPTWRDKIKTAIEGEIESSPLKPVLLGDVMIGTANQKNDENADKFDRVLSVAQTAKTAGNEVKMLSERLEQRERELCESRAREADLVEKIRKDAGRMVALREVTLADVRRALEIDDDQHERAMKSIGKRKWNAVNYVIAANDGFSLNDGIRALAPHFPAQVSAVAADRAETQAKAWAAVESALEPPPVAPRKPTKAETVKDVAITKQLDALEAECYRVTLFHDTKPTFSLGKEKGPDKSEKFYSKDEIRGLIPYLSARNAQGYNIFITPLSNKYRYILVDDITAESRIRLMKEVSPVPAVELKSSPKSIQMVFKIARDAVSHGAANVLFKLINKDYGDKNISGLTHPFRLVGFANKKSKHMQKGLSPFVELVAAAGRVCDVMTGRGRQIELSYARAMLEPPTLPSGPVTRAAATGSDIDQARAWYDDQREYWGQRADLSKIDRALAIKLRAEGYSGPASRSIIQAVSPNLASRHSDTARYLDGKTRDLWPNDHQAAIAQKVRRGHGYER